MNLQLRAFTIADCRKHGSKVVKAGTRYHAVKRAFKNADVLFCNNDGVRSRYVVTMKKSQFTVYVWEKTSQETGV
jgi:hypothetical protein